MFDINASSINRLVIHRVIAKTSKVAAYATYEESLCELNPNSEFVLKERLTAALDKSNKTFLICNYFNKKIKNIFLFPI